MVACLIRAGGADLVAQAMARPIFETSQIFSSGHMLMLEICMLVACRLILPLCKPHSLSPAELFDAHVERVWN